MSVIVKGMTFPKCCAECDFESHDEYECIHECPLIYKGYTNKTRMFAKLDDCPLTEIPDGVRLIDAKQFVENIRVAKLYRLTGQRDYANAFMNNSGDISTEWWCVEDMIDNAPTIFEED